MHAKLSPLLLRFVVFRQCLLETNFVVLFHGKSWTYIPWDLSTQSSWIKFAVKMATRKPRLFTHSAILVWCVPYGYGRGGYSTVILSVHKLCFLAIFSISFSHNDDCDLSQKECTIDYKHYALLVDVFCNVPKLVAWKSRYLFTSTVACPFSPLKITNLFFTYLSSGTVESNQSKSIM